MATNQTKKVIKIHSDTAYLNAVDAFCGDMFEQLLEPVLKSLVAKSNGGKVKKWDLAGSDQEGGGKLPVAEQAPASHLFHFHNSDYGWARIAFNELFFDKEIIDLSVNDFTGSFIEQKANYQTSHQLGSTFGIGLARHECRSIASGYRHVKVKERRYGISVGRRAKVEDFNSVLTRGPSKNFRKKESESLGTEPNIQTCSEQAEPFNEKNTLSQAREPSEKQEFNGKTINGEIKETNSRAPTIQTNAVEQLDSMQKAKLAIALDAFKRTNLNDVSSFDNTPSDWLVSIERPDNAFSTRDTGLTGWTGLHETILQTVTRHSWDNELDHGDTGLAIEVISESAKQHSDLAHPSSALSETRNSYALFNTELPLASSLGESLSGANLYGTTLYGESLDNIIQEILELPEPQLSNFICDVLLRLDKSSLLRMAKRYQSSGRLRQSIDAIALTASSEPRFMEYSTGSTPWRSTFDCRSVLLGARIFNELRAINEQLDSISKKAEIVEVTKTKNCDQFFSTIPDSWCLMIDEAVFFEGLLRGAASVNAEVIALAEIISRILNRVFLALCQELAVEDNISLKSWLSAIDNASNSSALATRVELAANKLSKVRELLRYLRSVFISTSGIETFIQDVDNLYQMAPNNESVVKDTRAIFAGISDVDGAELFAATTQQGDLSAAEAELKQALGEWSSSALKKLLGNALLLREVNHSDLIKIVLDMIYGHELLTETFIFTGKYALSKPQDFYELVSERSQLAGQYLSPFVAYIAVQLVTQLEEAELQQDELDGIQTLTGAVLGRKVQLKTVLKSDGKYRKYLSKVDFSKTILIR